MYVCIYKLFICTCTCTYIYIFTQTLFFPTKTLRPLSFYASMLDVNLAARFKTKLLLHRRFMYKAAHEPPSRLSLRRASSCIYMYIHI